jgi:peptide/nickel transport system substrate-binding protein
MKLRILLLIAFVAIFTMSLSTGSLASGPGKDTFIISTSEAVSGNWDPTSHAMLGQLIVEDQFYETFYKTPCYKEDPGKLIPVLALSHKRVDDLTIDFKLRPGVKFHDGSDFTAEDAAATINYYNDPAKPGYFWLQAPYKAQVIDKYTVRVKSSRPNAMMLYGLSFLRMMSAKDIKSPKLLAERPNGTGPYKFVKQDRDSTVLVVNESWWQKPPKVKNVHIRYVGDVNTRLMGLLSGEFDAAERLNPDQIPVVEKKGGFDIQIVKGVEPVFIHFRDSTPPFKDNPTLRRAMAYAIDREKIVKGIMGISGYMIYAHIPPTKIHYADVPDFPKYDPKMAQKLLAEAGYPGGKGLPELIYNAPVGRYPKDKEWATFVTAQWRAIGIPVKLIIGDPASWSDKLYNPKEGHIITCGWTVATPDPDAILFSMWRGKMASITFVDDPVINATLDKENSTIDFNKRKAIMAKETLPTLVKQMPSIPIAGHNYLTVANKRVKGFEQLPNGNFDLWKLEKTE